MSKYSYAEVRHEMLTARGIDHILTVFHHASLALEGRELTTVNDILWHVTGDSFLALGAIDMLIEIGKLEEVITNPPRQGYSRIVKFPEKEDAS